tara:strand:+ start:651 stop:842 length:192 start_codon:yes stop_codon:yes gene_type:complete
MVGKEVYTILFVLDGEAQGTKDTERAISYFIDGVGEHLLETSEGMEPVTDKEYQILKGDDDED